MCTRGGPGGPPVSRGAPRPTPPSPVDGGLVWGVRGVPPRPVCWCVAGNLPMRRGAPPDPRWVSRLPSPDSARGHPWNPGKGRHSGRPAVGPLAGAEWGHPHPWGTGSSLRSGPVPLPPPGDRPGPVRQHARAGGECVPIHSTPPPPWAIAPQPGRRGGARGAASDPRERRARSEDHALGRRGPAYAGPHAGPVAPLRSALPPSRGGVGCCAVRHSGRSPRPPSGR